MVFVKLSLINRVSVQVPGSRKKQKLWLFFIKLEFIKKNEEARKGRFDFCPKTVSSSLFLT